MTEDAHDPEDDAPLDPAWCSLCQDALPEGKLLIVLEGTQDVLFETGFRACKRCGIAYTDSKVCEHPEDGRVGVFQFEHDDFLADQTQDQISVLTARIENLSCEVCGDKIENKDRYAYSPRDFAIKMLRMIPESDEVRGSCGKCAALGLCPCCNGEHED